MMTTKKPARHGSAAPTPGRPARQKPAAVAVPQRHVLRLYITGATPASSRAVARVRQACEETIPGRYDLEVIDIYQRPARARDDQIIATPTLVRVLPAPVRRFIGDLRGLASALFDLTGDGAFA